MKPILVLFFIILSYDSFCQVLGQPSVTTDYYNDRGILIGKTETNFQNLSPLLYSNTRYNQYYEAASDYNAQLFTEYSSSIEGLVVDFFENHADSSYQDMTNVALQLYKISKDYKYHKAAADFASFVAFGYLLSDKSDAAKEFLNKSNGSGSSNPASLIFNTVVFLANNRKPQAEECLLKLNKMDKYNCFYKRLLVDFYQISDNSRKLSKTRKDFGKYCFSE